MTTIRTIFTLLLLPVLTAVCSAQSAISWDKWTFLTGTWAGEGSGQPGQGSGGFSFSFDLDQKILVRKSHTEFPASGDRPATVHDDLLVVYPEAGGNPSKAIYFDNEGHVIHYTIGYSGELIVLTSEKRGNLPVFRLTGYSLARIMTVATASQLK